MTQLLKISSSASGSNSVTEKLMDKIQEQLQEQLQQTLTKVNVVSRNLNESELPLLSPDLIGAYFTPAEKLSQQQNELLKVSQQYIDELFASDIILLGAPMYNFGIPASLKAYFDLIARANKTFNYTSEGPVGLVKNKKAILAIATGGTPLNSPYDFVSPYLKQFLNFIGITDIQVVAIDKRGDSEELLTEAQTHIQNLNY